MGEVPPLFLYILDSLSFFCPCCALGSSLEHNCHIYIYRDCPLHRINCQKRKARSLHLLRRLERMSFEDFGRVWFGLVPNGLQRFSELQWLSGTIRVHSHTSPKAGVHGSGKFLLTPPGAYIHDTSPGPPSHLNSPPPPPSKFGKRENSCINPWG